MYELKVPDHTQRLINLQNFLNVICIEANGYDLKEISRYLIHGQYDYEDAVLEWLHRGQYLLYKKEDVLNEN